MRSLRDESGNMMVKLNCLGVEVNQLDQRMAKLEVNHQLERTPGERTPGERLERLETIIQNLIDTRGMLEDRVEELQFENEELKERVAKLEAPIEEAQAAAPAAVGD